MDLKSYLTEKKAAVDAYLKKRLPGEEVCPSLIHKAMRYSVMAGGKRLRPVLCIAACEACGGTMKDVMPVAGAFELIHTYSLIHDDLPCMDDSDYRRGIPTNHKAFDEATAVLAGDGLLSMAFELIAELSALKTDILSELLSLVSRAIGSQGLVGGQVVDLESEGKDIDAKTLEYIHEHKTAALITAAVVAGGITAGAGTKHRDALQTYGHSVGLAFQIMDDILDVEGSKEDLGKEPGKDRKLKKATYASFYGLAKSKAAAEQLIKKAVGSLDVFKEKATPLAEIARFITTRDR